MKAEIDLASSSHVKYKMDTVASMSPRLYWPPILSYIWIAEQGTLLFTTVSRLTFQHVVRGEISRGSEGT
jgi:hypothetical protein